MSEPATEPVTESLTAPEPLVEVMAPDPGWAAAADAARLELSGLSVPWVGIEHIGSTSVPGLWAKPTIDLLGIVPDLADCDRAIAQFNALGYQARGEFGIAGRRYFTRSVAGRRTHHLHVFRAGSDHVARHLALRDYWRAHPSAAESYAIIKRVLVAAVAGDRAAYADAKAPYVSALEAAALRWWQGEARTKALPA